MSSIDEILKRRQAGEPPTPAAAQAGGRTVEILDVDTPMDETLAILDDVGVDPNEGETSFEQIYSALKQNEALILEINEADEDDLRRGLSVVKQTHNNRLMKDKQPPDTRQIAFKVLERIPDSEPAQIKLQVWFRKKRTLIVHKIMVPDSDF